MHPSEAVAAIEPRPEPCASEQSPARRDSDQSPTRKTDQRREANRRNATHSTGPVTPEGKRKASLNALRHGLTGQTVVLPSDDLAAYQKSCDQFHAELKPKGLLETKAVQSIADTYWRLDRIRAMENNLFALALEEQEPLSSDPLISSALAQARSLDERADLLARLSLYEQRLNRTLVQAHAQLKQLQQERAQAESRDLEAAEKIRNLKEALDEPWQPGENGFEFSSSHLEAYMRRRQLLKEADDFHYHGELPDPPSPPATLLTDVSRL
jgi:hypothetical protein